MMERSDFYCSLSKLPRTYNWNVEDNKTIAAVKTRGPAKGKTFNPVTAIAHKSGLGIFGHTKRDTLKAGTALGLPREFTSHVYAATTSVSNRGNAQVVRGKIRSALEI